MKRLQMKLSGEILTLFDMYAKILLKEDLIDDMLSINKEYLLKSAFKEVPINEIAWEKVRDFDLKLTINLEGIQTTLLLEEEIIELIELLRKCIKIELKTERVYRPYVIKLVLKAVIIKHQVQINEIKKSNNIHNIRITQQNLNKDNTDISTIVNIIKEKSPEIIFFQEYCNSKHKKLKEELNNYNFYYPIKYDEKKDEDKMLCVLAIKKGYEFVARERELISLNLRYIEGKVTINDFELELLFIHVPQTYPKRDASIEYNQDRVEYKGECLFAAYLFVEEYKEKALFVGGDFNVDIRKDGNGKYLHSDNRFQNIFEKVYKSLNDTANDESTWGEKKYDYALVSNIIKGSESQLIKTSSDHKIIVTEIKHGLSYTVGDKKM